MNKVNKALTQLDLGRRGDPYRLSWVHGKVVGFAPATLGRFFTIVNSGNSGRLKQFCKQTLEFEMADSSLLMFRKKIKSN